MKIVFFLAQMSVGGAEQVAILLSRAISELGHDVVIVTARPHGDFLNRVSEECRVITLNASRPIRGLKAFSGLIHSELPDAVVCFGFATGIAASMSSFIYGWKTPIIVRAENNLQLEWAGSTPINKIIGPPLSRWVARHAHVVAVSKSILSPTISYLRMPASRTTTIMNPVIHSYKAFESPKEATLHPWLADRSIPTFVAMGRLEAQKGFDTLIDAFSILNNKARARLVIFGTGSLQSALESQIKSNDLSESIALAGYSKKPLVQMAAAHAFVLSSRFEGFGLVIVEALFVGAKVISTNCDFGPAELLENGRYGKLVPIDDAQSLADTMLQSLQSPWEVEYPDAAWFEKFTAKEAARQHLELIEKLRSGSK